MILFQNRKSKRGRVFRNRDKLWLPPEAEIHKYGSSSRVLLHLKSNRSWKMLSASGNICAKVEVTVQEQYENDNKLCSSHSIREKYPRCKKRIVV
jgi:hypothetical protein